MADDDDADDAPDSDAPARRGAPKEPISLARYAFVIAALSEGYALFDVLEREGLSEDEWESSEEHWVDALDASADSDLALHEEFDRALAGARSKFARTISPLDADLAAYLGFQRRFMAAERPLPFLADHGLFFGDWVRLQEGWSERLSADPEIRARASRLLASPETSALPAIQTGPRAWPASPDKAAGEGGPLARPEIVAESEARPPAVEWGLSDLRDEVLPEAAETLDPGQSADPIAEQATSTETTAAADVRPSFMRQPVRKTPEIPAAGRAPTPMVTGMLDLQKILQKPLPFAQKPAPAAETAAPKQPPSGAAQQLSSSPEQQASSKPDQQAPSKPEQRAPSKPAEKPSEQADSKPDQQGSSKPSEQAAAKPAPDPFKGMTAGLPTDLVRRIAAGQLPFARSAVPGAAPVKPAGPPPLDTTGDLPTDLVKRIAAGQLPFAKSAVLSGAGAPAPPEETLDDSTPEAAPSPAKPAVPFQPKLAATPPGETLDDFTLGVKPSSPKPAVPFQPKPAAPVPAAAPPAAPPPAVKPATPPPRPAALPQLTLEQYASMCAELAVFHDRTAGVFAKYGLTDPQVRAAVDAAWKERLSRFPSERAEWERRYWQYEATWRRTRR